MNNVLTNICLAQLFFCTVILFMFSFKTKLPKVTFHHRMLHPNIVLIFLYFVIVWLSPVILGMAREQFVFMVLAHGNTYNPLTLDYLIKSMTIWCQNVTFC